MLTEPKRLFLIPLNLLNFVIINSQTVTTSDPRFIIFFGSRKKNNWFFTPLLWPLNPPLWSSPFHFSAFHLTEMTVQMHLFSLCMKSINSLVDSGCQLPSLVSLVDFLSVKLLNTPVYRRYFLLRYIWDLNFQRELIALANSIFYFDSFDFLPTINYTAVPQHTKLNAVETKEWT